MGLFDSFFGTQKESQEMAVQEAFAGVLLGAAAADGHIADEEAEGLWTILARMKMFDSWTGQKFSHMMDRLVKISEEARRGWVARPLRPALARETPRNRLLQCLRHRARRRHGRIRGRRIPREAPAQAQRLRR